MYSQKDMTYMYEFVHVMRIMLMRSNERRGVIEDRVYSLSKTECTLLPARYCSMLIAAGAEE